MPSPFSAPLRRFLAFALFALVAVAASGQTRPKLLDAGIENPASAIYIGNSFFYFNKG